MKLVGSRVVAALLLWLAVGFLADAALTPLQQEAFEAIDPGQVPETTRTTQLVVTGIGAATLVAGLVLFVRDPGPPRVPEDAATGAADVERGPSRCWRCRASWPQGAERCPACGAERLR